MTIKPRTIGESSTADISRRYAEDSSALDLSLITGTEIAKGLQLPEYTATATELATLLGLEKNNQPWANFTPPPNFTLAAIFLVFLLPSIGVFDDQKDLSEKIKSLKSKKTKEKKEKEALLSLLNESMELEKTMEYIRGKRGQFGKG